MNKRPPLDLSFPPDLSDEAAYEISEFLQALSLAFEDTTSDKSDAITGRSIQNEANSSIRLGKRGHSSR